MKIPAFNLSTTKARTIFLAVVCGIMYFNRLGTATLIFDDAYYAQKAKEMLRSGDMLVPVYAGAPDFQDAKPILHYWLLMASAKAFGSGNFAARFGGAVFGAAGIALLFLFAKRFYGARVALASSLVLCFTQQYMHHARSAQPDVMFTFFFTLAVVSYFAAASGGNKILYLLTGLSAGLAVMTRNAPGFLALAVVGAHAALTRRAKIVFGNAYFIAGMLVCAAVIAPWFVYMSARFGDVFVSNYIGRVASIGMGGTGIVTPWHTIIARILENYWPWLPFLAVGLWKETRAVFSRGVPDDERSLSLLLLAWIVVPFAVFQAASVKGSQYIMPVYVPFAVVTARAFAGFKNGARWIKGLVAVSAAAAALYLIFPLSPATLDVGHYGELSGIVDEVRSADSPVYVPERDYYYFSNALRFYADADVRPSAREDIESPCRRFYVMKAEDFSMLSDTFRRKAAITARTENFVAFVSGGS